MIGRFSGSLRARLLGTTLTTAALAMAALVALVIVRSGQTLSEQALEVSRWSEAQLADRLLSDARLATARLQSQREDVDRRFATLAKRWDIAKAVFSGNTVAASELLRPALALADMDGVIAFDMHLRALTADRVEADLLEANKAIRATPLAGAIGDMLRDRGPNGPKGFVMSLGWTASVENALAANETGRSADVFGQPLLDDFGDVIGTLVGYRLLRPREPTLQAFANISGRDVLILSGTDIVSSAGATFDRIEFQEGLHASLKSLPALGKVARCIAFGEGESLCAVAPLHELQLLAGKVVGIGEESSRSLVKTLCIAALLAIALVAVVLLFLSNRITRPLVRITRTVAEVARGNWQVAVPDVRRVDEVGDIARAIVSLEHSLEERDQLRQDVVTQNTVLIERESQLRIQNDQFNAALNNMSQGLCMFDADGRLEVVNDKFLQTYRVEAGRLRSGATADEIRSAIGLPAPSGRTARPEQGGRSSVVTLADGRQIEISTQPMSEGGWVETHEDVTAARNAQARIAHAATHDALTGLPNRILLADRLAAVLAEYRNAGRPGAVLCLDLDDFKAVNDTMGHPAGDELLKKVGQRLTDSVPPAATVARLGGDEFAIVLPATDAPGAASGLAEDVLERLRQPFRVAGQVVRTNASIGVAVTSGDTADGDDLLRRGDLALYAAKADGNARVRVFEMSMEENLNHRRWLERELRLAIDAGDIAVHYQPLFGLSTNTVNGFEALARWRHPERGQISPGEFIPVAESTGLINALGAYVLRRACEDAVRWPGDLRIAVNISPIQFRDPTLDRTVETVLRQTGLRSNRLELEITESVVLNQEPSLHAMLKRLRKLGVRFSMDDFGTGYSSLSSLNTFKFDKIKLDQSFVRNLVERAETAAIVHVVAELGRSLKITTVAEGVETHQQLARLRTSGFTEVQGYLFSAAIPASEVPDFIMRTNGLNAAA